MLFFIAFHLFIIYFFLSLLFLFLSIVFINNKPIISVYNTIVNVLMNFYGYKVLDSHNAPIVGQTTDGIKRFKIWFNGNLEIVFMRRLLDSMKITQHYCFPLLYERLLGCCQDHDFVSDVDAAKKIFKMHLLDAMKGCEKYKRLYNTASNWCNS